MLAAKAIFEVDSEDEDKNLMRLLQKIVSCCFIIKKYQYPCSLIKGMYKLLK